MTIEDRRNNSEPNGIVIDEETAALLEAIADGPEDDVDALVEIAGIEPDAFAAFLKATGRENTSEAKTIMEAAIRLKSGQKGPQP